MIENEQIEIPLSKKKMTMILLGSIIFVIIGFWFIITPPVHNPVLALIAGITSILFFGAVTIIIFRKLSDKKAGLIIRKEGIFDNSSGVSAGLIPWSDIEEIKVSQIMNQKFLMLIVRNPESYLEKISNPLKRKTMEMNYKSYGSPISISANALKINFDDLQKLLHDKLNEYRS